MSPVGSERLGRGELRYTVHRVSKDNWKDGSVCGHNLKNL